MNLIIFEIKGHLKSFVLWSAGMIFLIYSGMAKLQAYEQSGQSINELFQSMPGIFKALFGISDYDLSTAEGFFVMLFLYILLLIALYASTLGSEIIAKESRDKTNEFLLSKPISRQKILWQKALAGLIILGLFIIITTVFSVFIVDIFNKGPSISSEIWYLSFSMIAVGLFFYSLGVFIASSIKNKKNASQIAVASVLASYLVFVIYKLLPDLSIIKYISIFDIFEAGRILQNGYSLVAGIIVAIIICLLLIFASINYKKIEQSF